MQAGDYLLMNGVSVRITRANDRFVVLDSGQQLTITEAERFKCSSQAEGDTYTDGRKVGRTHISNQLGLL